MLKQRKEAAEMVAAQLHDFELSLDETLAKAARLAAALPEARRHASLSATVGQDAYASIGDTLSALYQARQKTVEAHHQLAEIHKAIGLKVYASGMLWKLVPDAANEGMGADAKVAA